MAEKPNGEYYYDAGTINEQLDDYEVYEHDGRLYLNREGTGDEAIAMDGLALVHAAPRTSDMDATDLAEGEGALYVLDTSGTYSLEFAFHVPGGSVVVNTLDPDLNVA